MAWNHDHHEGGGMHASNNTSTDPPVLDNPRGYRLDVAISVVLVIMTIVVAMRLWGRYRYRMPSSTKNPQHGESMFWIKLSDVTVVVSYASFPPEAMMEMATNLALQVFAVALTAICYVLVQWGEGLHGRQLSRTQIQKVLEMFYVYQVLYKFLSGIAKIATLFLLLAISMPHMRFFNLFCKIFAAYIALYCIATSIATVFQCGTAFSSNWNKSLDQSQCFDLPPFWFAHAAINVSATAVMAILPWWLFSYITYKRKHAIATIMSAFAIAETVLGAVRLYGLHTSAHSKGDLPYGTLTGLLVSQLEVDFACIAACVPTVLKMLEEVWVLFCVRVLGRPMTLSGGTSNGRSGVGRSRGGDTINSGRITLSDLRSVDRDPRPTGPYTSLDKDDEGGSMESQEHIVKSADTPIRGIKVQKDYSVRVEEDPTQTFRDEQRARSCKGAWDSSVVAK